MINLDALKTMSGIIYTTGTLPILSGTILMRLQKINGLLIQMLMMRLELSMLFMTTEDYFLQIAGELLISKFKWELQELLLVIFSGLCSIQPSQGTLIIKDGGLQQGGTRKLLLLIDGNYTVSQLIFGGSFTLTDILH